MHALTRKNAVFEWTVDCSNVFDQLKERLITALVLSYPDKEFILETDASGVAILFQSQDHQIHPIAYGSRTLDPHEHNYGISELETLGLVWAACEAFSSVHLGESYYSVYGLCSVYVCPAIWETGKIGLGDPRDGSGRSGKKNQCRCPF